MAPQFQIATVKKIGTQFVIVLRTHSSCSFHIHWFSATRFRGSNYVLAAIAETITSNAAICPHVVKAMGGPRQFAEYEVPFAARSKRALIYDASG